MLCSLSRINNCTKLHYARYMLVRGTLEWCSMLKLIMQITCGPSQRKLIYHFRANIHSKCKSTCMVNEAHSVIFISSRRKCKFMLPRSPRHRSLPALRAFHDCVSVYLSVSVSACGDLFALFIQNGLCFCCSRQSIALAYPSAATAPLPLSLILCEFFGMRMHLVHAQIT